MQAFFLACIDSVLSVIWTGIVSYFLTKFCITKPGLMWLHLILEIEVLGYKNLDVNNVQTFLLCIMIEKTHQVLGTLLYVAFIG